MDAKEIKAAVANYTTEKGIGVGFKQIPKVAASKDSGFRNSPAAHWSVSLTHEGKELEFQYHEGVGRFVKNSHLAKKSIWEDRMEKAFITRALDNAERVHTTHLTWEGKTWKNYDPLRVQLGNDGYLRLAPPHPAEVLYCICSDYAVMDYSSFEDWANSYGYDTDSRKAERIYRECLEQALKLKSILGPNVIAELQELTREL